MPIPTTNLLMDLKAGVGITASGGRISAWAPQAGSITDPCTQATGSAQPFVDVDMDGETVVSFPWDSTNVPKYSLDLPASFAPNNRAVTVFVVASFHQSNQPINLSLVSATGIAAPLLGVQPSTTNSANVVNSGNKLGTFRVPINKNVVGGRSSATAVTVYNGVTSSALAAVTSVTGTGGGKVGGYFVGALHRVVIYGAALSDAEITQLKAALIEEHAVTVGQTKRLVCIGDSITAGFGVGQNMNWTRQLPKRVRDVYEVYNLGFSGMKIGASGTGTGDMYDRYAQQAKLLVQDAGFTCDLVMLAGTNDMTTLGAGSQATVFSRMTGYFTQAQADAWNKCVIMTLSDRTVWTTTTDAINTLIRAGNANFDGIIDIGKGSTETRLSDASSTTYFSDGLHPTAAGAAVIAENVANYFSPVSSFVPGFFAAF